MILPPAWPLPLAYRLRLDRAGQPPPARQLTPSELETLRQRITLTERQLAGTVRPSRK